MHFQTAKHAPYYQSPEVIINQLTQGWNQTITAHGPYSHMITCSMINPLGSPIALRTAVNKLLGLLMTELNVALAGFSMLEPQLQRGSRYSRPTPHYHILLKKQPALCNISTSDFSQLVGNASTMIADASNKQAFNIDCIDARDINFEAGIIEYLLKSSKSAIWKNPRYLSAFDFITPLNKYGYIPSDTLPSYSY